MSRAIDITAFIDRAEILVDAVCRRIGLVLPEPDRNNIVGKIAFIPGNWRTVDNAALVRAADTIELNDPMLDALVWDQLMTFALTATVMSVPDPSKRGQRSTNVKNVFALACRAILFMRPEKGEA